MRLVGYSDVSKAFRLLDTKTKRIITSRDVKFIESDGHAESNKLFGCDSYNGLIEK